MTGFAAILGADPADRIVIEPMLAAMDYRASDHDKIWHGKGAAIAAKVLHTSAESSTCDQPHINEDGSLAVAFDGYLQNFDELRRDLIARGHVLRNRSDVELVLRAYQQWGDDTAHKLEGEFALVVVDLHRREVYVARDHAGLRPLYFAQQGGRFLVSTDISAVVAAMDPPARPNTDFLAEIMAIQVYSGDGTVWSGVKRLRQSHWGRFRAAQTGDGVFATCQYWTVPTEVTIRYKRDEEYVEHYLSILTQSIRRASRTDRLLAMTVSGGLDSSALFCLADQMVRQGQLLAPDIQGYSLAAEPGSPAYELPYARAAADHVGRTLEEVPLFAPDLDWYRRDAAERREFPISTNTAMSFRLRQRVAENGSRVVMGGHGGDEWLQGSSVYYRQMAADLDFHWFFKTLWTQAGEQGWRRTLPYALRQAIIAMLPARLIDLLRSRRPVASGDERAALFWLNDRARDHVAAAKRAYLATLPKDTLAFLKQNLISQPLGDFGKSFTTTQYARIGIESRSPMFARSFIEFSARTPEHIKYRGAEFKAIHRVAMRGILPPEILNRRMKAHFPSEGIEAQFVEFYERHGERLLQGLVDPAGMEKLLQLFKDSPIEEDAWGWEVWGAFGAATFLLDNSG